LEYKEFIEICAAIFGLLLGSFANVCISRLPDNESVVQPRSHCRGCGAMIAWYDNIPLLSFVLLGGRCRSCKGLISWRYPTVEALAVRLNGLDWAAAKWCLFGFILVELLFSDLESRILPDEFTLGGWMAAIALAPLAPPPRGLIALFMEGQSARFAGLAGAVLGSVVLAGLLWAVGWAYLMVRKREGLGLGDVKLLGMMAAFLGLESAILVLLGASLAGSVIGLTWIKWKGEDASTFELPFGSFLGAAGLLVALVAMLRPAAQ
jgi:leader peptidase (prepilin peptidase)/N-methyltransferase